MLLWMRKELNVDADYASLYARERLWPFGIVMVVIDKYLNMHQ